MAKGISINIGVNQVDPAHYDNWPGRLCAAESDAVLMAEIAQKKGFETQLFLVEGAGTGAELATSDNIIGAIKEAAHELKKEDDILLLTFAGHGSQTEDDGGDEPDRFDETWLLYDRQLVDDELYELWAEFKKGVRIFVLSDSCNSGTIIRLAEYDAMLSSECKYAELLRAKFSALTQEAGVKPRSKKSTSGQAHDWLNIRTPPYEVRVNTFLKNRDLYLAIQKKHRQGDRVKVDASVLLISACQDDQLAIEDCDNGFGVFTLALLKVWKNGAFKGNYREFHAEIKKLLPPSQIPNFFTTGIPSTDFEEQIPFTI